MSLLLSFPAALGPKSGSRLCRRGQQFTADFQEFSADFRVLLKTLRKTIARPRVRQRQLNNTGASLAAGWCDFRRLAEQYFLDADSSLDRIQYLTAPVEDLGHRDGEERRQNTWLNAVRTIPNLRVYQGFYAGKEPANRREKQTNVNLAVRLILDALQVDGYDSAILVSGDTDLAPAVMAVQKELTPKKAVQVCVPLSEPPPYWTDLSLTEGVEIKRITAEMLLKSRLPDSISTRRGTIHCLEKRKLK